MSNVAASGDAYVDETTGALFGLIISFELKNMDAPITRDTGLEWALQRI